ncbi:MAG: transcription-repair coupling factor, partial [Pseudomonadota bacterium]
MLKNLAANRVFEAKSPITLANVPAGSEALILAEAARRGNAVAYVLSDGQRMADIAQNLSFVAPDIPVLSLPGWDCLPYDRVSPSADAAAMRLAALSALIAHQANPHAAIVLISVNALMQKALPRQVLDGLGFSARPGNQIRMDDLAQRLATAGFDRVPTVREVGEYAIRGGILDTFVPGQEEPLRLDFFGDTLE